MVDDEFDRDVLEQNGLQRVNTLLNVMGVDEWDWHWIEIKGT